jgi:large subunit ribosomal protein L18
MIKRPDTNKQRQKRHKRVRSRISGTPECPRLNVFRSGKNIYAQMIDDINGVTICSASTVEKDFESSGSNKEGAKKVGLVIAQRAKEKGLRTWCLTAADISTTDAFRNLPREPARAASNFNGEEETTWPTATEEITEEMILRRSLQRKSFP